MADVVDAILGFIGHPTINHLPRDFGVTAKTDYAQASIVVLRHLRFRLTARAGIEHGKKVSRSYPAVDSASGQAGRS